MSYRNDVLVLLQPLKKRIEAKGKYEELKNITKNTKKENIVEKMKKTSANFHNVTYK